MKKIHSLSFKVPVIISSIIFVTIATLAIILFMFEDFLDLVTDIILMLLTCLFVFFYSVCFFIVDVYTNT